MTYSRAWHHRMTYQPAVTASNPPTVSAPWTSTTPVRTAMAPPTSSGIATSSPTVQTRNATSALSVGVQHG